MAITVQPYPISTVRPEAAPGGFQQDNQAGLAIASGANRARDEQAAGAYIDKAADTTFGIFEREAKIANDTRVEGDVNAFISAKQKALYTDPTAFYRLKGEAAIDGAQAATDKLLELKKDMLAKAGNTYQRDRLANKLDAHLEEATNGISRHVASQAMEVGKINRQDRIALASKESVLDAENPDTLGKSLMGARSAAVAQAVADGFAPDSDHAKLEAAKAESGILKNTMQALLNDNKKRAALGMYDKYKDSLGLKDDTALHAAMKGIRTEVNGEQLADEALRKVGLPGIPSDDNSASGNRENNIGNLRPRGASTGFQTFNTFDEGVAATVKNLQAYPPSFNGGKPMTLQQIGAKWAPKGDGANDPNQWAKNVGSAAGLDPAKPLDLNSPEVAAKVARGIHQAEWGKARPEADYLPGAKVAFGMPNPTAVFKGDLKAGFNQAAFDISNSAASKEDKQAALAILNKQSTQVTSYQTAAVKSLRDEVNTVLATSYVDPSGLKLGTFAAYADKAASLGEQELATRYKLYAAMEGTIKNGLAAAPADQLKMLKEISEGLPKQLLEGIQSGNAELLAKANDGLERLKKAQADGLDVRGLKEHARATAQLYADAGKGEKAKEVAQTYGAMLATSEVLKADPVAQKQAMAEIEGVAAKGQATEQQLELYHLLRQGVTQQAAAFEKDGYATGVKLLGLPALPLTDGAGRAQQAAQIAASRGLRPDQVAPMSAEEFTQLRSQADGNPQAAQKLFQSIAANYPPETIPTIAAGIAGKHDTSDPVSRGYAAALSFYGKRDAGSVQIAGEILDGVAKRRDMGDSAHKMPKSSAFFDAIQTKVGNAFVDMGSKVPAVIADAAEAIYTSRMVRAGRQGEKSIDTDVLNQALDAVVGKTIVRNGQTLLPPKGVDSYQLDTAVRALMPLDVGELRTLNGSPVTVEKIARYGILTNAGGEGRYFVQMPDAAQGGKPAYVQRPDGEPFVLDIKPLLGRPPVIQPTNLDAVKTERRRAPASPTEGLQ